MLQEWNLMYCFHNFSSKDVKGDVDLGVEGICPPVSKEIIHIYWTWWHSTNHEIIETVFFSRSYKEKKKKSWQVACLSQSKEITLNTLKCTSKFYHNIEESKVSMCGPTWGWLSLAYNWPTWVTCRFHLAEWPSRHIPKDIGAGLAKWYGWVMGCRPHPDTLWRWGAAAKPWSPLTSPCGRSVFANMSPHELLFPSLTRRTIPFAFDWITRVT